MILWIRALHLIFMVTWFCGLFYLPRLFVYHAQTNDPISIQRFKVMERRLYYGITTPGGVGTLFFGGWLLYAYAWQAYQHMLWLHIKLGLIALLVIFHVYCGYLVRQFKYDRNRHGHVFYRYLNEFPTLILIATIILATVKPF